MLRVLCAAVACVLLLAGAGVEGQASNVWITQITDDEFGSDVVFMCNSSLEDNQRPNNSYPVAWMFTDLTNAANGFNGTKHEISDDGETMTVKNVQKEDFGIYHCMLMTLENEWYLIKLGLNVRGPYYQDLWEYYRSNTIIGLSAFFIWLAIGGGVMLVYKLRYIPDEEEEAKPIDPFVLPHTNGSSSIQINGKTNPAYDKEKEPVPDYDNVPTSPQHNENVTSLSEDVSTTSF